MTIPKNIRRAIENGRSDTVESEWLAHLEEHPTDVEFFLGVARSLKGAGVEEEARWLLELADDEWRSKGHWTTRMAVLRGGGALLLEPAPLHDAIVETVKALYPDSQHFDEFFEFVGLHRAVEDTKKTWDKADRLAKLVERDVGSIVWMDGKGAGRVTGVNFQLQSLLVEFEQHGELKVNLRAAGKLLQHLPEGHFLRTKLESPDEIQALKDEQPPGVLLQTALSSYERPLAAAEIRDALHGVVTDKEWSSWWASARKHPQILAEGKGARQTYRAVASQEEADQSVVAAFDKAPLREKLNLFKRHAQRQDELRETLGAKLKEIASTPGHPVADRFSAAVALEAADRSVAEAEWSPEAQLRAAEDPVALLGHLEDTRTRARALDLALQSREDAKEIASAHLTREGDPKLLDRLATSLPEESLRSFFDRVVSQPRKQPAAFTWFAERGSETAWSVERNPVRFLRGVLDAPRHDEFVPFRSRLETVFQDGALLQALLRAVPEDQAEVAEDAIRRSLLEEYSKQPLLNALHLRFPALDKREQTVLYALRSSIERVSKELKQLHEVEIPANRKAIEEARELGDLRENFEYKSARERHEYLNARLASLENDLSRAQPIDVERDDAEEVRVASTVTLKDEGEARQLTILGPWESEPEKGVVSYDSDLGQALLGKRVGDSVSVGGSTLSIEAIQPFHG